MSVDSALVAGRRAAAARMTSTCNVRRKTGGSSIVGGFKVPTWETVHSAVACRVAGASSGSAQLRTVSTGAADLAVPVRVVSFAYDTTDLRDGDLIELTAGDTDSLVLRIVEADPQDQATARRVLAVGTARPTEWA